MRKKIWIIAAALLVLGTVLGVAFMKNEKEIVYTELTNPVWPSGNDPWVVRQGDDYYLARKQ